MANVEVEEVHIVMRGKEIIFLFLTDEKKIFSFSYDFFWASRQYIRTNSLGNWNRIKAFLKQRTEQKWFLFGFSDPNNYH